MRNADVTGERFGVADATVSLSEADHREPGRAPAALPRDAVDDRIDALWELSAAEDEEGYGHGV